MIEQYDIKFEKQFKKILESLKQTDGEQYAENYWDFELHKNKFLKSPYNCWLYFNGEKVVGYAIGFMKTPQLYEIFNIYILPDYRGQGLARTLLNTLIEYTYNDTSAQIIASNVGVANIPSRKLHEGWIEDNNVDGWSRFLYIL